MNEKNNTQLYREVREEAQRLGLLSDTERIFTTKQLAEYLGVSLFFIHDHTRGNDPIPCYKVGGNRLLRFKESEVLAWLEKRRVNEAA